MESDSDIRQKNSGWKFGYGRVAAFGKVRNCSRSVINSDVWDGRVLEFWRLFRVRQKFLGQCSYCNAWQETGIYTILEVGILE